MKIKKFTARTFSEALVQVKKELSEHAVILSTEEKKGIRPHVVVTAAIDYDLGGPAAAAGQAAGMQPRQRTADRGTDAPPAPVAAPAGGTPRRGVRPASPLVVPADADAGVAALTSELGSLKAMLEGLKNSGFELALPPQKRAVVRYLRERAVRDEYALRLSDRATSIEEIPFSLAQDIKVKQHAGSRKAVMLMGPTGVGKTTTVAKLAAQAVKSGRKAALINLDTYRIGAVEQIRIYARILGIPLAVATNLAEFRQHLSAFARTRDVVFIDTVGRSPRDEEYLREMAEACSTDVPLELHLLMGANSDDEYLIDAYRTYRRLPISYLAFTKVDEAVRFGPLYNILLTYQKPVAYLTTGQRVPADIEFPTANRLADLIVRREYAA